MMVVEQVSFADLYIHPLNPRLDPPQAEIDARAANIRELGLIQRGRRPRKRQRVATSSLFAPRKTI